MGLEEGEREQGQCGAETKGLEGPLMGPRLEEGKAKVGLSQERAVPGTESFTKWKISSL